MNTSNTIDPYFKLRSSLPSEEICTCANSKGVKLIYALSDNPFQCIDCNREINLSTFKFDLETVEELVSWRDVYSSIYKLWLDSGEYEKWAAEQLLNIYSPINQRGLSLSKRISDHKLCFYWYFHEKDNDSSSIPLLSCPSCGHAFETYNEGIFPQHICKNCFIITNA